MIKLRKKGRREASGGIKEPMRQFMMDRAVTLYYEARQFPKTRRVAATWTLRALRFAKQTEDVEMWTFINEFRV